MNVMWQGYTSRNCTKCGADLVANPNHKCAVVASNWFEREYKIYAEVKPTKKKVYKKNRNT